MASAAAAGPAQWVQANVASNGLAILTLDRPKALNAMNLGQSLGFSFLPFSPLVCGVCMASWALRMNGFCINSHFRALV